MTILWADGFDDWTYSSNVACEYELANVTAGANAISAVGRRGTNGWHAYNAADFIQKTLPASYSELFASVALAVEFPAAYACVMRFYSGTTAQVSIRVNADGSISAVRGTETGVVLGTSAVGLVRGGIFHHYQVRVVFSTTGGIIQVRLNGAPNPVLSLSGQNTTGPSANAVRLTAAVGTTADWDDFVINDTSGSIANSWLGDVRVDTYRPSGNGDLSQMVGSDGNSTDNYLLVSPAAPVAANYAQSAVVGAEDLYQFADLTHTPTAILGVLATAGARKDDAGARTMRVRARSGGIDQESAGDFVLSTSRVRIATSFENDPATGLPWTKAGLNAAQFGCKISG